MKIKNDRMQNKGQLINDSSAGHKYLLPFTDIQDLTVLCKRALGFQKLRIQIIEQNLKVNNIPYSVWGDMVVVDLKDVPPGVNLKDLRASDDLTEEFYRDLGVIKKSV